MHCGIQSTHLILIILSLHIASYQVTYCTIPDHIILYWSISYLIMNELYGNLKQDSLQHVVLPKIHWNIKPHTILCHSKYTAFYHHDNLYSIFYPYIAWNILLILYIICSDLSIYRIFFHINWNIWESYWTILSFLRYYSIYGFSPLSYYGYPVYDIILYVFYAQNPRTHWNTY